MLIDAKVKRVPTTGYYDDSLVLSMCALAGVVPQLPTTDY